MWKLIKKIIPVKGTLPQELYDALATANPDMVRVADIVAVSFFGIAVLVIVPEP